MIFFYSLLIHERVSTTVRDFQFEVSVIGNQHVLSWISKASSYWIRTRGLMNNYETQMSHRCSKM